MADLVSRHKDFDRRQFLAAIGKGVGLMTLASSSVASLFKEVQAATKRIATCRPIKLPATRISGLRFNKLLPSRAESSI
jgi:hypothetical protein